MKNKNDLQIEELEKQILEKWKNLKDIVPDINSEYSVKIINIINKNEAYLKENNEQWKNNRVNWVIPGVLQDTLIVSSLFEETSWNEDSKGYFIEVSENREKYQSLSDEYYNLAAQYNKIMIGLLYEES
jgi:hypothetical protein